MFSSSVIILILWTISFRVNGLIPNRSLTVSPYFISSVSNIVCNAIPRKPPSKKSSESPKSSYISRSKESPRRKENGSPSKNVRDGIKNERDGAEAVNTELDNTIRLSDDERLQKVMARAGISSRRKSEQMILDGMVSVNGKIITELGQKVNTRKDLILVNGVKIKLPDSKSTFWVMLNKPKDVLTTMEDQQDRNTILEYVPKAKELRLLPVGGLDRDSTGLLILTNDNGWIHPLTHPSFNHVRKFEVVIGGFPTEAALQKLRDGGILIPGDTTPLLPCEIQITDADRPSRLTLLSLTLKEMRRFQIQHMVESMSCTLVSVKQIQFGPVSLKGLRKGQWRELTSTEINKLKLSCKPGSQRPLRTK